MLPRTAATLSISWCTTRRRPGHWSNAFAYDHAGNRTGLTYFDGTSTHSYTYDYNTLNQLTSRTSGNFVRSYLYDANGNRTRQQDVVSSTVMGTWEYDWNEDDRLVAFRVKTGQGNVTKTVRYEYCRTCGGQRTGRIEYDDAEMVVEWLRYEMDGLNHLRIDEVYDADSNGELEDPSATGDAWRVQRVYVNGPGQLGQIAKVIVFTYASATTNTVASEEFYYYHYDILGNVSVISDPNGDEADQFEQDAFGNLVSGSWSGRVGGITEQMTTKPYDADLGLYYFNARWYDPVVGAFISRDRWDRHSLYRFTNNTPPNSVDPTGNAAIDCNCTGQIYYIIGPLGGYDNVQATAKRIAEEGFTFLYPNATFAVLDEPKKEKTVHNAFHKSDTIGVIVFSHGLTGAFLYSEETDGNEHWYRANQIDNTVSDLQFYVGMHCHSGDEYPAIPGSPESPFCSQTHSAVCQTKKGALSIHGAKSLLYKSFHDIAKKCKKRMPKGI